MNSTIATYIENLQELEEVIQEDEKPEPTTKLLHNIGLKHRSTIASFYKKTFKINGVSLKDEHQAVKHIQCDGKEFFVLDCVYTGGMRVAPLAFSVGIETSERKHIIVYSDCNLSYRNMSDLQIVANCLSIKFTLKQFAPRQCGTKFEIWLIYA